MQELVLGDAEQACDRVSDVVTDAIELAADEEKALGLLVPVLPLCLRGPLLLLHGLVWPR